jgi:hypothetical protein
MPSDTVQVPGSLLLSPDLPATAKLIWMISRLPAATQPAAAGTSWLASTAGLARNTVLKGKALLTATGWEPPPTPNGTTVPMPTSLLTNSKLGAMSRVLYGLLLLTPSISYNCGTFTYAELAALAHVSPPTIAKAIYELAQSEWIKVERNNRLSRVQFELTFPGLERGLTALAAAQERLKRPRPYGEALMCEWLNLLIDSDNYHDNTNPGYLQNPRTAALLEFDRFYPPSVAWEFNGPQHDRPTQKFTAKQVAVQRERDLIKLGICVERGITLVVITPDDLTFTTMQRKVGNLLPLRDLAEYDLLIEFLESESLNHRQRMAKL